MKFHECKEIIEEVSLEVLFQPVELEKYLVPGNYRSLCGRYLVKKSLLDYFQSSRYLEISILNDKNGKPEIFTCGGLMQKIKDTGVKNIMCSISHSRNWIASMVVIE
ncbi:MAG: hypothetical protein V1904_08360 [Bacteroidota bacterium]